jgi:chromosomal replication initiation ATPase DnaA
METTKIEKIKFKIQQYKKIDEKTYYISKKHDQLHAGTIIKQNGTIKIPGTFDIEISEELLNQWLAVGYVSENQIKYKPTTEDILSGVCKIMEVNPEVVGAKCRKRELVEARQYSHYLCKELNTDSLSTIGFKIGRKNHTTVLYSYKTVCNLMDSTPEHRENIQRILIYLKNNYEL